MKEKDKWESRYDTADYIHGLRPAEDLYSNRGLLPRSGTALDIASGEGQNAVFLAQTGLEVFALDFSILALKKCLSLADEEGCLVQAAAVDLENFAIPQSMFDVIINFNYLQRGLAGSIIRGLKPGGLLIFETLTQYNLKWRPDFNPDFLLSSGELIEMFAGLHLIKYREATIGQETKPRSVASLIARKL
ncbi:MAG TPA: methyltransferase domain-containing protein [Blastocatellia bacterium]|nr:methyltransferase domain-containing protein [Blastocatellia bacterium]